MASNLRVDTILPSTGTSLGIGTASGTTTITGTLNAASATITGNLGVGGVLTYEDVTNIDSVGVITGRSNINCTSGRFQRGTTTVQDGDAIAGGININGTDMDASVIMSVFGNDGDFTRISGSKSRNASVGSHTIVQNNDVLLSVKGFGSDGTNFEEAAQIEMQVDGTPGNNVMPGRILFKTTATDGVVERLRIHSNGLVTAPFQYHLHAERSSNQTGYNAQGDFGVPMIFNHIVSETRDSSLSSCFNTSTGVFTAPVLGLYIFNASALSSGNNVFSQSWFTLNGSRANGTDWHNGQTSHSITQNTQVIRLAAGNTVGFKPYAAGQSSLTLSSNSNHTYLKVTLIG